MSMQEMSKCAYVMPGLLLKYMCILEIVLEGPNSLPAIMCIKNCTRQKFEFSFGFFIRLKILPVLTFRSCRSCSSFRRPHNRDPPHSQRVLDRGLMLEGRYLLKTAIPRTIVFAVQYDTRYNVRIYLGLSFYYRSHSSTTRYYRFIVQYRRILEYIFFYRKGSSATIGQ
jgi:hypothetical protein